MSDEKKKARQETLGTENEKYDPYKKYKEYKWEDPEKYKNGPVGDDSRECRDCFCCIFFILFLLGCVIVAFLGFLKGRPLMLLYVYDEDGKACGHDEGYEDYPFLYFYNTISNLKSLDTSSIVNAICVKKCPFEENKNRQTKEIECKTTTNKTDCKIDYLNYYQSKELLNRFCFPSKSGGNEEDFDPLTQQKFKVYDAKEKKYIERVIDNDAVITDSSTGKKYVNVDALEGKSDANEASSQLINWSFFSVDKLISWISDLIVTKYAIAGSVAWSFILAMFFCLFLRCCSGFIVFTIVMGVLIGLGFLAYFFRSKMYAYKEQGDSKYEKIMKILFWVFVALTAIWLIFILAMCNRLRLAVALIQVTAKYVNKNCCILIVPFFFFFLIIIWMAYWVVLAVYLYATGDFDKEGSKVMASFVWDQKIRYSFWYHLFALFYIDAFIVAYSQFVYASSASIWYFNYEKGEEGHLICKSFYRGLRFYLGSLAFGSLIVAIIRFIMFLIERYKKKLEKTIGKAVPGKCYKCLMCCIQCCLNCIGKTIEFINKNAYIMIAIKGDNFCKAAWEGFGLMVRNLGRFSVLVLLGKLFSLIGSIFISVASGVVGYFVITYVDYFSKDLNSFILPVCCMAVIGLIIGIVTMSVFGTSGDALLFAFLVDEELNKGQAKAFPELQKFMSDER